MGGDLINPATPLDPCCCHRWLAYVGSFRAIRIFQIRVISFAALLFA